MTKAENTSRCRLIPRKMGFGLQVRLLSCAWRHGKGGSSGMAVPGSIPQNWVWAPEMDQHTFDRLTRAVAAGQSRRGFLRRMFGVGAAVAVSGTIADQTLAAPIAVPGTPNSTVPLQEPSEPTVPSNVLAPNQTSTQTGDSGICVAPLISTDCGCLDPKTQNCCQDEICSGTCTAKDGCCNVSSDKTVADRGEVCSDHCCHPHLDPSNANYSECCGTSCCAGHCYGEDLCCPVNQFCPGTNGDLCCGAGELCCGAGTESNICIPGGAGACCGLADCAVESGACYVGCEAGFCHQHYCDDGAVCCDDGAGGVACAAGDCCNDAGCGAGQACLGGYCTAVECFGDGDCTAGDACSVATCQDGVCNYAALCEGECMVCSDGACVTDDSICGLCGTCDGGTCTPVVCQDGYSCYDQTGECLGIA